MSSLLSLFVKNESYADSATLLRNRAPISGILATNNFGFKQKTLGNHVYMEAGQPNGQPIIFCHGLFGSFRNFAQIGQAFSNRYRIIVPCMPMYDAPLKQCTVEDLGFYLKTFIDDLGLKNCIMAGNSMGGGAILTYTIENPENVSALILFASSGLSFIPMKSGFMQLKKLSYVKELVHGIFYDGSGLSDDEIMEVYKAVQNKQILLRCFSFTRSTKKNFLHEKLKMLQTPSLIIWGRQDQVTPAFIAEEFKQHLSNSELHYIDQCGHVPCYEKPEECIQIIKSFLK